MTPEQEAGLQLLERTLQEQLKASGMRLSKDLLYINLMTTTQMAARLRLPVEDLVTAMRATYADWEAYYMEKSRRALAAKGKK